MVYATKDGKRTRTYKSWESMKQRCLNPNAPDFPNYGGRGIYICSRWKDSYANFYADMGERPNGTSLDRVDNSKGYEPNNCKWSTATEQQENRRSNPRVVFDGREITVVALAKEIGIPAKILIWRLNNCWELDRAVSTPKFLRKGK